jgi:hypothetical protein
MAIITTRVAKVRAAADLVAVKDAVSRIRIRHSLYWLG